MQRPWGQPSVVTCVNYWNWCFWQVLVMALKYGQGVPIFQGEIPKSWSLDWFGSCTAFGTTNGGMLNHFNWLSGNILVMALKNGQGVPIFQHGISICQVVVFLGYAEPLEPPMGACWTTSTGLVAVFWWWHWKMGRGCLFFNMESQICQVVVFLGYAEPLEPPMGACWTTSTGLVAVFWWWHWKMGRGCLFFNMESQICQVVVFWVMQSLWNHQWGHVEPLQLATGLVAIFWWWHWKMGRGCLFFNMESQICKIVAFLGYAEPLEPPMGACWTTSTCNWLSGNILVMALKNGQGVPIFNGVKS